MVGRNGGQSHRLGGGGWRARVEEEERDFLAVGRVEEKGRREYS